MTRLFWRVLLLLISAAFAAAQTPEEPEIEKTLSPYFFVESDDPAVDQLPLLSTEVDAAIAGVIADVTVAQTYKNDGTRPIEALYVFPASTRAAVYGMKMTIGDRVITAEIREREQARKEYETAKQEGRSVSLLEQQRPNVFQMNVANILPGDLIIIELHYTELLTPRDGVYEFVYPTVVGPRYSNMSETDAPPSEKWVASPYQHEGEAPLSTFDMRVRLAAGLPIREIVCPSHQTRTAYDGMEAASVGLAPEEANGGNRDFILRYRLEGDRIETGLLLAPGADEDFFLLMVQPPHRVEPDDVPPREYIIIMDVSGSMDGFPIETSKTLLRNLLMNLRPFDSFNVIFFAGDNWVLSPQSLPAGEKNIEKALKQIDKQKGSGGTELLPALETALGLPGADEVSRTVVIATDGYVRVEAEAFDVIRKNLGNANFFTFGIGTSVNRHILEGMAHVGMGEPFVITKPEEAADEAERFLQYIESPVFTGIRIQYNDFEVYDAEPEAVPDLFSERPIVVFGKYRGAAQGTITVAGSTASGPYRKDIRVAGAKTLEGDSALRYLWARHRIQELTDYGPTNMPRIPPPESEDDEPDSQVNEVTQLGLKYNLLTPYTSFVAVDQIVRSDGQIEKVSQPLPLPQGVRDLALPGSTVLLASSPSVGMVIPRNPDLEDLPLRGDRHWQGLLPLVSGATLPLASGTEPLLPLTGTGPHMDGQPKLGGAFEIDDIETGWGKGDIPSLVPGMEAVGEVTVRKGTMDAEQGHMIASVTHKAGTNAHHGGLRALVGNEATRAADYFSHLKPGTSFGQLGFTLNGPVIKNKLFYAASYQYTRDDQGPVYRFVLPTQAFRQGDFSAADTTVYDPATGNPDGSGRQPFPDNRIPAERISPISKRILDLLPLPTLTDAAPGHVNYETTGTRTSRTQAVDARVDWNLNSNNRLSMNLSLARPKAGAPALVADYGGAINEGMSGSARQLAVSTGLRFIRTWTPTFLMEAQFDFSHFGSDMSTPGLSPGLADSLGIPGGDPSDIAIGAPSIVIEGYSTPLLGFAGNMPRESSLRFFHGGVVTTKVWRRHTFRWGGDIRRRRAGLFGGQGDAGPRGTYLFGPFQTATTNDASSQGGLANAFAGFLLDAPDSLERSLPARTVGTRSSEYALFVEDDWRVTDKLQLTFGWRYEYDPAPSGLQSTGGLSNYDPEINTLRVAGYGTVPGNLGIKGSHSLLLPRVKASWQVSRRWIVLQGGYGIHALPPVRDFYGTNFPISQNDQIIKTGAFLPVSGMASGLPPVIEEEVPPSGNLPADSPGLLTQRYFTVPGDPVDGRLHTWNTGVRFNYFPGEIRVDYVGNRGRDIPVLRDLNAGTLPGAGDIGRPQFEAFGRRASTFTWWLGRTDYDALQISFTHFQSEPLWIRATYTLGRSLDYASENGLLATPADPERSRGRSDFDRRHTFATAFVLKTGKNIDIAEWIVDLLKDWKLSGFFIAQSGTPVNITAPDALLNAPGNVQRPDMTSRPAVSGGIGPGQPYFDTSVFSMPDIASWGNLERNYAVDGPGIVRLDMAVSREIGFGGDLRLELRAECFNVTNTPQFVNPSGGFGAATFGQVTHTVPGSERSMRFGIRIGY